MTTDLTIVEAISVLRVRWRWVASSTLLCTCLSLAIALIMPPIFRAEVVLMPSDRAQRSTARGIGQYEAIGMLTGLAIGANSLEDEGVATLTSRILTESFIRDEDLLPVLFHERWDAKTRKWKADLDEASIPTLWDGNARFASEIRRISDNPKSGLVTLAIEFRDPALAAHWANELVRRTNELLRARALERSARNIAFLEDQIKKTSIVELRQSIYGLLEGEINTMMLAQGNEEYAFRVIDPAAVPRRKARPRRLLIVVVGFFGGLLVSSLAILMVAQPSRPID